MAHFVFIRIVREKKVYEYPTIVDTHFPQQIAYIWNNAGEKGGIKIWQKNRNRKQLWNLIVVCFVLPVSGSAVEVVLGVCMQVVVWDLILTLLLFVFCIVVVSCWHCCFVLALLLFGFGIVVVLMLFVFGIVVVLLLLILFGFGIVPECFCMVVVWVLHCCFVLAEYSCSCPRYNLCMH